MKKLRVGRRAENPNQPRNDHEADENKTAILDFHHDDLHGYPTSSGRKKTCSPARGLTAWQKDGSKPTMDRNMSRNVTSIGLISDTHGLLRPEALRALEGSELIIHAGDVGEQEIIDALKTPAPVVAVR